MSIRPVLQLLSEKRRKPSLKGRERSHRRVVHLVWIERWLLCLAGKVWNPAIPEIAAYPNSQVGHKDRANRREGSVRIHLGLTIAEPAGHDSGLFAPEQVDLGIGSGKACLEDMASGARAARRLRQRVVVEHEFAELLHRSQLDQVGRYTWWGKGPDHRVGNGAHDLGKSD